MENFYTMNYRPMTPAFAATQKRMGYFDQFKGRPTREPCEYIKDPYWEDEIAGRCRIPVGGMMHPDVAARLAMEARVAQEARQMEQARYTGGILQSNNPEAEVKESNGNQDVKVKAEPSDDSGLAKWLGNRVEPSSDLSSNQHSVS